MVGLSSNLWWYEDGGIVYPKKKEKMKMVLWRRWSDLVPIDEESCYT